MNETGTTIAAIVTGVIGLAIVAVLVSKNSQTPTVISNFGSAIGNMIGAAVAPVTGGSGGMVGAQGPSGATLM